MSLSGIHSSGIFHIMCDTHTESGYVHAQGGVHLIVFMCELIDWMVENSVFSRLLCESRKELGKSMLFVSII